MEETVAVKFKLDKFIEGELIDLCIPTPEYAKESDWYSYFNIPSVNKYLEQGAFPNTREDEESFYISEKGKRLILIITDKEGDDLGVISLSFINYAKRTCDLALVLNEKPHAPLAALEAMARIMEHAFTMIGIERIHIGQHEGLVNWQKLCELVGFKVEGVLEKGFIKGRERSNAITSAALVEDFDTICKNRGGHLWDSNAKMFKRVAKMPKKQFYFELEDFLNISKKSYYNIVFNL